MEIEEVIYQGLHNLLVVELEFGPKSAWQQGMYSFYYTNLIC